MSALSLLGSDSLAGAVAENKSDPFCEVWIQENPTEQFKLVGTTEKQKRKIDVQWNDKIAIDYFIGNSKLKFVIWDHDRVKKNDYLGQFEVDSNDVVAVEQLTGRLIEADMRESDATIIIVVNELPGLDGKFIEMHFKAKNLEFTRIPLSPYLKFVHKHKKVIKTKPVNYTRFPTWKPILISASSFGKNHDGEITIELRDRRIGTDPLIAFCNTTINRIAKGPQQFPLKNDKHQESGKLILTEFHQISFMDYYPDLTVPIIFFADLTESNVNHGFTKEPLHFNRTAGRETPYHKAMENTAHAIKELNRNNNFEFYGKLNESE